MKTSGFTKVVYTSGASPMEEDKAVIKDYTFEWDGMFSIRQFVPAFCFMNMDVGLTRPRGLFCPMR